MENKDKKIKYIMFDFDNTLVRSLDYWFHTIDRELFLMNNLEIDKRFREIRVGKKSLETAEEFVKLTKIDKTPESVLNQVKTRMKYYYENKILPIPGVYKYLDYLKSKGYKLILASATDYDLLMVAVKHFKFETYFDCVLTENMVGFHKKDTRFLQSCLERIKAKKNEVFFFEDSPYSLHCANVLGIRSCALMNKYNVKKLELFPKCELYIKNYKSSKLKFLDL